MFDYRNIEREVKDWIAYQPEEFADDFDVDGIMDELRDIEPEISSIDDIDPDDWMDIIARHDVSGK